MKFSASSAVQLLLVLVFACAFPPTGRAQDDAKQALAEQLITLLKVEQSYDESYQKMTKVQDAMLSRSGMTPEQIEQRRQAAYVAVGVIKQYANWDVVKPMFVKIYTDIFTVDELKGMIDFYKSPVGQQWLQKQPLVEMAKTERMSALLSEIQPKIMAAMREAKEKAAAVATPAASPVPAPEAGAPAK